MNFDIKRVKICVPIPIDNVEEVREAVFQAGLKKNIDNYKQLFYNSYKIKKK